VRREQEARGHVAPARPPAQIDGANTIQPVRIKGFLAFEDAKDQPEEFAHGGPHHQLAGFTLGGQALAQGDNDRIFAQGAERGHVNDFAQESGSHFALRGAVAMVSPLVFLFGSNPAKATAWPACSNCATGGSSATATAA